MKSVSTQPARWARRKDADEHAAARQRIKRFTRLLGVPMEPHQVDLAAASNVETRRQRALRRELLAMHATAVTRRFAATLPEDDRRFVLGFGGSA